MTVLYALLGGCVGVEGVGELEQALIEPQGVNMQGVNMQGVNMQGMALRGFRVEGAMLAGHELTDVRVEQGELVAEDGAVTLHGPALVGARLFAEAHGIDDPTRTALVTFRITTVQAERAIYDPTATGGTFLYGLEQWVDDSRSWQPACDPDTDGRRVAIPLAATWDGRGDRHVSSSMFTFGCTTGVIAKCYRWGYRPWITGYGDVAEMHWTCTRLARADYCGDGVPHTVDGTAINVWDTLPAPGPIQAHADTPPSWKFEAAWNTSGAICINHERLRPRGHPESPCPDRMPPACRSVAQALAIDPTARMFDESPIHRAIE